MVPDMSASRSSNAKLKAPQALTFQVTKFLTYGPCTLAALLIGTLTNYLIFIK